MFPAVGPFPTPPPGESVSMSSNKRAGPSIILPAAPRVIMGVDPGLASTGVGVITSPDGQNWRALDYRHVITARSMAMSDRLARIHDLVETTIRRHQPDSLVIESIFFARNVRSAVLMAHGRGAAILAAARSGIALAEYSPMEIKQSVLGKGRADKNQVKEMVRLLLGLPEVPASEHEADALACALCHAFRSRLAAGLARATEAAGDEAIDARKAILAAAMTRRRRRR